MIQVYAGFDEREEVGYHTFVASVIQHATAPVSIAPLSLKALNRVYAGTQRDGTNAFIYTRFLVPFLQKFTGMAIFVDGCDMVCKADIHELASLFDPYKAVQVVKHDYKTKHARKYVGTSMEADNQDYPKKNWSSVMLINCAHYAWRKFTPEYVAKTPGSVLHRLEFIEDRFVGELPQEWNWLADEYGPNDKAKLIHWTAGIPGFDSYINAPMAEDWFDANTRVNQRVV